MNAPKTIEIGTGSCIGICAPAARFDPEKFENGLGILKDMGFKTKVPEPVFEKKRYLAGEDSQRARTLEGLFKDDQVNAILCARGGFGAMRILDHIDWDLIRAHPKPFVGFSDITALLTTIIEKTGNPVIHGPTLLSLAKGDPVTLESFFKSLTRPPDELFIENGTALIPGNCAGHFLGGNLATLSHLMGTCFQPAFDGAVLFLEDIGEPAYKIDRMLSQMKLSGVFKGLKGVVCGDFVDCQNAEYLDEIFIETFEEFGVPVLSGLQSGHGQVNLSLRMGERVEMDTARNLLKWK